MKNDFYVCMRDNKNKTLLFLEVYESNSQIDYYSFSLNSQPKQFF